MAGAEPSKLQSWIGKPVVVDTAHYLVYIGELAGMDDVFIELRDVDMHDVRESNTTKEKYIHHARKHGPTPSRQTVLIDRRHAVSISLLDDVLRF